LDFIELIDTLVKAHLPQESEGTIQSAASVQTRNEQYAMAAGHGSFEEKAVWK
jgi:hypothetical protein